MKRLIMLAMLLVIAASVMADTTTTRFTNSKIIGNSSYGGLTKDSYRFVATPSGYVFLLCKKSDQAPLFLKYNGSAWSYDSTTYTSTVGNLAWIYNQRGDTTLFCGRNNSSTDRAKIRRWLGTTYTEASDTASLLEDVTIGPGWYGSGINLKSDGSIFGATNGYADYYVSGSAPSWSTNMTWTFVDSIKATFTQPSWSIPVCDGLLGVTFYGLCTFANSTRMDSCTGTVLNPGAAYASHRTAFTVLDEYSTDSALIGEITQIGDTVKFGLYKLDVDGVGADAISNISTTVLVHPDSLPTPASPGVTYANPCLSKVRGTDTLIAIWKYWPNQAVTDSMALVYKMSEDNGATWGDWTLLRQASKTTMQRMVSPPFINYAAGEITGYTAWIDSTIGSADFYASVFSFTIGASSGVTHTISSPKLGHTSATVLDVATGFSGTADSMYLLLSTSNPPTTRVDSVEIVETDGYYYYAYPDGLSGNTKYYYRFYVHQSGSPEYDSSAVDSFTTLNTLAATSDTVHVTDAGKTLGSTTAWLQFDCTDATVETYNGYLRRAYFVISETDATPDTTGGDEVIDTITTPTIDDSTYFSGLSPSTKYYFRCYVFDSSQAVETAVDSFTTLGGITVTNTCIDTNVTSFLVEVDASSPIGPIAGYSILYDTDTNVFSGGSIDVISTSPTDPDTFIVAGLLQNTWYFYRTLAVDSQVTDTSALDSVQTKNGGDYDVGELLLKLDSISRRLDSVTAGLINGSYSVWTNIAAAIYSYQTSESDRFARLSDAAPFSDSVWKKTLTVYSASADTGKAGYTNNWNNLWNNSVDSIRVVKALVDLATKTGFSLSSTSVDDIQAEILAAIASGGGGTATAGGSTSLNEILNPYFNKQAADTFTTGSTILTVPGSSLPGWYIAYAKGGTGGTNNVMLTPNPAAEESTLTGGWRVRFNCPAVHASNEYDYFYLRSNYIKLFPGSYKFGIRACTDTGSTTTYDTVRVSIIRASDGVTLVTSKTNATTSTYTLYAGQYVATDTMTVRLFVDGFVQKLTGESVKSLNISNAFLTPLGYNQWAIAAATARAISGSVGDSLQKISPASFTASDVATALLNASVSGSFSANTYGALVKQIDSVGRAILDTMKDGPNGLDVNIKSILDNTASAYALASAWDSLGGPRVRLYLNQLYITDPPDLGPAIYADNDNGLSTVSIIGSANAGAPTLDVSGQGGVRFRGTFTGSPGLTVDGQGSSADVSGIFPVDATIALENVSISCQGDGANLVSIRLHDTINDAYPIAAAVSLRTVAGAVEVAAWHTNDSGWAHLQVPDGNYTVRSYALGYRFPIDTIVVSGDVTHTVSGALVNSDLSSYYVRVYGNIGSLDTLQMYGATVTFSLPQRVNDTCSNRVLTKFATSTQTDRYGNFSVDLLRSSCVGSLDYNMTVRRWGTETITKSVTVPDSSSYQVIW